MLEITTTADKPGDQTIIACTVKMPIEEHLDVAIRQKLNEPLKLVR